MKYFRRQRQHYWFFCIASLTFVLVLISGTFLRLAIAHHQTPTPQAILTLGGDTKREEFTAQFAQTHSSLEIWVSTGIAPKQSRTIFRNADISDTRVHLDRRAVDTVTNFTSLVEDFKRRNIQHVYLITSDYHMPRAKAIATVVFGSQGIAFTPIPVPSSQAREPWFDTLRDTGRAFVWLVTGFTGAVFKTMTK